MKAMKRLFLMILAAVCAITSANAQEQKAEPVDSTSASAVDVFAIKTEADKAYDEGNYARAFELYMQVSDDIDAQNNIGYYCCPIKVF